MNLPDELILIIFSYLDTSSLLKTLDVNRIFRSIASDWTLWTQYHINNISKMELRKLFSIGIKLRYLSIFECRKWMLKLNSLRELEILLTRDDCELFKTILISNPNLKYLKLGIVSCRERKCLLTETQISNILGVISIFNRHLTYLYINVLNKWLEKWPTTTTIKIDIEDISRITSLIKLHIGENVIIDFNKIDCLKRMENLSELNILSLDKNCINDKVGCFDVMKLVKILTIDEWTKFECDIELPNLNELEYLGLSNSPENKYLTGWLMNCENLTKLKVMFYVNDYSDSQLVRDIFVQGIFNNLIELHLGVIDCNYIDYIDIDVYFKIESLKKLTIEDSVIDCCLSGLINLTELNLISCEYNQKMIDSVGELYNLRKLNIKSRRAYSIIPDINYCFSKLTNLTELHINNIKDTDDFYINLPKNITTFSYSSENLDSVREESPNCNGIRFMKQLKNLELIIYEIDVEKILNLASIGLEKLSLYATENKVTDAMKLIFKAVSPNTILEFNVCK